MSEKHHEIARLLLLGMKRKEVAKQVGITKEFVSVVKNSPVVKAHLDLLKTERDHEAIDIAKQINEALPRCVELLKEQMEDDSGKVSPSLKSKNAFGLLSAGGHGPSKKLDVRTAYAVLSPEDIASINARGSEIKKELDDIIDVTPKSE